MGMVGDIILQVLLFLLVISVFLYSHDVPRKLLSKLRPVNQTKLQAKRHFVRGAQLLAQARSANSSSLAKAALAEAEKSLELDPADAAAHILKALALDLQGFKTSALDSLDAALSPLAAKSLAGDERGDALMKRAELKIAMDRHGRVDSAAEDLKEAVKLSSKNAKAFCLLGECYELKEMKEAAKLAYQDALNVEPGSTLAQAALDRLAA